MHLLDPISHDLPNPFLVTDSHEFKASTKRHVAHEIETRGTSEP